MPCLSCVFYILSVFIITGNSLTCMQCSSYTDTPCTGTSQTCPSSSDVCATTRIRNSGNLWQNSFYIRSCVSVSECDIKGTVTGLYVTTLSSTTCCNTTDCVPSAPSLPAENSTANGLFCPSYVDSTMEPCDIKNQTQCTGDQNLCIRYSSSTTLGSSKSSLYLGGCASKSLCDTKSSYISSDGFTLDVNRLCNNRGSNLHYNTVFTSLSIVLLFIRVFFGSTASL
ncbi:phospholipase A2 inhibitor and Ly6/PLAUR domain-containing protein [Pelodytes ibericus]